jgi:hypothetical protein
VHDQHGRIVVAREPAALAPALDSVPEAGEDAPPVGLGGKGLDDAAHRRPPLGIPAQPHVEGVQREQLAQLEPGDPGQVEPLELGREFADRFQPRAVGQSPEHGLKRAGLDRAHRAAPVERAEHADAALLAWLVVDQDERRSRRRPAARARCAGAPARPRRARARPRCRRGAQRSSPAAPEAADGRTGRR